MTSSPAPPPHPPLRLHELVAACMSAAWLAGEVIREVVADGVDLAMVNKAEDKYDPQTVADRRAQQRMVHALRALYPQLQIVGEEGELEAPEPRDQVHADVPSLLADVPLVVDDEQLTGELDAQLLVVWMDPLDGTKMFAAKKYDEVSVLLGIAYNKRPIAGVMHLPFHGGKNGETLWGGPSLGVYKTTHRPGLQAGIHVRQERPAPAYPDRALHITTSGTPCALVDEALALLTPARVKYGGATGTMAMSVLTGESDAFFRFRNATKRWDICAIEPLLEALGGKLVDKHGRVYLYDPKDPEESDFDNAHGLIASMNDATHKLMQDTMEEIHVTRTLDGGFMTPQWLEQYVFPHGGHVQARRIVPGSIRKGKHSIVAKLEVDVLGSQSVVQTKHVFLKRYVQEELPPRAARNWARDLISYRCEARFYESVYPHLVLHPSASIGVIKPLHVQFRIDSSGRETGDGFLVLLENVVASTPLEPADRLTREDTQHALKYLAGLHAASIQSPELLHQVKTYLWPSGTWWSFEKRGVDELRQAPVIWKRMLEAFHQEIEASGLAIDTALKNLGERMVEHAAYISDQLFGEPSDAYAPLKTLVHGDFKTGNLFFHADTREVTAFDWQWAGLGLGALDVANLLNTSVGIEALADEEGLLRFYYGAFQQALGTGTVDLERLYPFEAFTRHVDLATLEYARVLIANFWDDTTPASCVADAHKANWGLGYRSVPHVLRLVHKLHHGLARFSQEQPAAVE